MLHDPVLKTKRLKVTPLTDAELEELTARQKDPELKQAYGEMLNGCRSDPQFRLWYTAWEIRSREDGSRIGDACFKGPAKDGAVEIGYGIDPGKEDNGYATEAARVLIEWAFSSDGVWFVDAETAPDNAASQRVLEKLLFLPNGEGEEGPRYRLERPKTTWTAVYLCLGLACGMSIGMAMGHMSIGMCLGMLAGVCLGIVLDAADESKRKELRKKWSGQTEDSSDGDEQE